MATGARSQIRRGANRSAPGIASEILTSGLVAHAAFCEGRQPFIIPFAYHYDLKEPDVLYLHGSSKSRAMRVLASGKPTCIAITTLEALVFSKTAFDHTMNYTSLICFGRGRLVAAPNKLRVLETFVRRYFSDRKMGLDYEAPTAGQMRGTSVVAINIEEYSVKRRSEGPNGPLDENTAAKGSCGLVPTQEAGSCPVGLSEMSTLWRKTE